MTDHPHSDHDSLELGRLVALIDGVFAVALTLLVLDLKLPDQNGDLSRALGRMIPAFIIYLIAFASVAGHWTIHHTYFRYLRRTDSRLVFLSLLSLLFITLFPLAASIAGAHPLDPLAASCLSANSLLYCLSAWATWSHLAVSPRLLEEGADPGRFLGVGRIMLLVAIGLALAIPLAYLSVFFAYAIWILWPAVSAGWVRRRWKHAR
jgi:uncharacterized membrane protein